MSLAMLKIALTVVSAGITIAYLIFLIRVKLRHPKPLKLSDQLGIAGSFINAFVLIIAMASLIIAIDSYESANKSGNEQLKALEASKNALNSVVKIVDAQQQLLSKSLQTHEAQLTISKEQRQLQRQRERERPEVLLEIIDPSRPSIIFTNISNNRAIGNVDFSLTVITQDQNDENDYFMKYSSGTKSYGPISAGSSFRPVGLDIGLGGRLFGYLLVNCQECQTPKQMYWINIENGKGWYHKGSEKDYPFPLNYKRSMRVHEIVAKFRKNPQLSEMRSYMP